MSAEFRRELIALLEKHNATIEFTASDCSDFYGISGEKIVVTDNKNNVLVSNHGYHLDASHVRENYPYDEKETT